MLERHAKGLTPLFKTETAIKADLAGGLLGEERQAPGDHHLGRLGASNLRDKFGEGLMDQVKALARLKADAMRAKGEGISRAVKTQRALGNNLAIAPGDNRLDGGDRVPDAPAADGGLRLVEGDAAVVAGAGGDVHAQVEEVAILVEADGEGAVAPGWLAQSKEVAIGLDDGEVEGAVDAVEALLVDEAADGGLGRGIQKIEQDLGLGPLAVLVDAAVEVAEDDAVGSGIHHERAGHVIEADF